VDRSLEGAKSRYSVGVDGGSDRTPYALTSERSKIRYRRCPECGEFMQRKNFAGRSGVIVDWCGDHGTWLDADELELISAFVLSGGMHEAPAARSETTLNVDGVAELIRAQGENGGVLTTLSKVSRRTHGGRFGWTDLFRHLLDW
jgi:Zn-finger nucleic acid-binding protein